MLVKQQTNYTISKRHCTHELVRRLY